jgi:hypothetical protein
MYRLPGYRFEFLFLLLCEIASVEEDITFAEYKGTSAIIPLTR